MKLFDFVNDIDWSKNIVYLIVYILIISFCALFYLLPIIQNHRTQTFDYKKSQNLESNINLNIDALNRELQATMTQNATIRQNMRNHIDLKALEKHLSAFMTRLKVSDLGIHESDEHIQIQRVSVSGHITSTTKLIALIESLDGLENSVRLAFPLDIQKPQNARNGLNVSFALHIYYSTYALEGDLPQAQVESQIESPAESSAQSQAESATPNPATNPAP